MPSLSNYYSTQTFQSQSSSNLFAKTEQYSSVKGYTYLEALRHRRTVCGVTDNVSVSDGRIIEIVNEVIQALPSSWNMQSTSILVTLGKEHKRFWDAIIAAAKRFVLEKQGEEDWKRNEDRFKSFQAAYDTVCVYLPVSEKAIHRLSCSYFSPRLRG